MKLHHLLVLISPSFILLNVAYAADPANGMVSNAPKPFINANPVMSLFLDKPVLSEGLIVRPSLVITIEAESPEFIKSQQAIALKAKDIPIVISEEANTANLNIGMVTNTPGRQDPANYPRFLIEATGKTRECILSGFERRRIIDPSGEETYQGTLPSLRMVASDISDIPSWHAPESDCIISISSDDKSGK